jgi:hypothetical protein
MQRENEKTRRDETRRDGSRRVETRAETNESRNATDVEKEEVQCCRWREELYAGHRDVMMRWRCWNMGAKWEERDQGEE